MFENILDRIRLFFRKDKESYLHFYRILGFYPRNIKIYKEALLHKTRSVKTKKGGWVNNERLEFLGDAVLDAVVADILYKHFEGRKEGFLTNTRSKIVQRSSLNRLAACVGLDKYIKASCNNPSHNNYLPGNAFEAMIGALYLDRGYEACKTFMETRIIGKYIDIDAISQKEVNFKSKLLEWSQKNHFKLNFRLLKESRDKSGSPTFASVVVVEGIEAGSGKGYAKKASEQTAAKKTLEMIKKNHQFVDSVVAAKKNRLNPTSEPEDVESEEVITVAALKVQTDEELAKTIREAEEKAFKEQK